MISNGAATTHPGRRFGEVIGRVSGLHELHDKSRLTLRLATPEGALRTTRADRTKYFKFTRLTPGAYELSCSGVFGGVFNEIHVGSLDVVLGIVVASADVRGCVIRGSVAVRERPVPLGSEIELRRADGTGARHTSHLDKFARFFFSGLRHGDYVLAGHLPGQGFVDPVAVSTNQGELRLPTVALRTVGRLRIRLRGPRGGAIARGYRLLVRTRDGSTKTESAARFDGGWLVERPDDSGRRYRIEIAGRAAADGEAGDTAETIDVNLTARGNDLPLAERVVRVWWD